MTVEILPPRPWNNMDAPIAVSDDPEEATMAALELAKQHGKAYALFADLLGGEWEGAEIELKNNSYEISIRALSETTVTLDQLDKDMCIELRSLETTIDDIQAYIEGAQNDATDEFYAAATATITLPASMSREEAARKILEAYEALRREAEQAVDQVVKVKAEC